MEIIKVNSHEFESVISDPYHCFNTAHFNEVNENKCDELHYLLFKDKKYRLGIIGGKLKDKFISPFSAPFGGFSFVSEGVNLIKYIDQAIGLLEDWCHAGGMNKIHITLPPSVYNPIFISKQLNSLYRFGYDFSSIELNYHFINKSVENNYIENIPASARKSLKQSLKNNLSFYKCKNSKENIEAYEIILKNRTAKNFPLKMKYSDIEKTKIRKDFFLVKNENEKNIAAAIVYFISSNIVQVIYWGDDPDHSSSRQMNFLSYNVFKYYQSKGILYTDIGPSTENSIPNYGLSDFKEAIGCEILPKYLLEKKL